MRSLGIWRHVAWWMGHFVVTLGVAAALRAFHPTSRRAAAQLLLAGVLSGVAAWMLKWTAGRMRPFKGGGAFHFDPFIGGWQTLLHGWPNLAFPSGHSSLAFAAAATLHRLLPKYGRWTFGLSAIVAVARVGEGAHYPSDVVAGAMVGMGSASLAAAIMRGIVRASRRVKASSSFADHGGSARVPTWAGKAV